MKSNKIKFIPHIALIVFFTLTGFSAFAHFGSKGPYGGSVSCGLAYDSLVYWLIPGRICLPPHLTAVYIYSMGLLGQIVIGIKSIQV